MTTQNAGRLGGRAGRGQAKVRSPEQLKKAGRACALIRHGGAAYRAGKLHTWLSKYPHHGPIQVVAPMMISRWGKIMQD